MSDLTFSNNLIKMYTNKNVNILSAGAKLALDYINGKIGLIYDDYDYKGNLVQEWKKYKLEEIYINSPRKKTINMDDKIFFHNIMKDSVYTPESYLSKEEIDDKESLYFVKNRGGTGGKGVNIYNYEELLKININNCVIQKNISNPDLHMNKRYKIRQMILIYNKNIYVYKKSFFTASGVIYNSGNSIDKLKDTHVINQNLGHSIEITNKLDNFDLIFANILLAVRDFKKFYNKEIDSICENEYSLLGLDFIVDDNKNVQIIEINHRSNYRHPETVSFDCDISLFKDTIILLKNNNEKDTNFENIN